jgi:hypothetical protein
MGGRKLEEQDWTEVYCRARGFPVQGWSNLNIDVMYRGVGVEMKMLAWRVREPILSACGETRMHPAATRSIRISSRDNAAADAMREVMEQYQALIETRRAKVRESAPDATPDLRTGWLLWEETLREFLYFEQPMQIPALETMRAEWVKNPARGNRKASTNLWIYDRESNRKLYSVTTDAGAKIQPYFEVPLPNDPNLHHFVVQGEPLEGLVRLWLLPVTKQRLQRAIGDLDPGIASLAFLSVAGAVCEGALEYDDDLAQDVLLSAEAYQALQEYFEGASDEMRVQSFLRALEKLAAQ